MKLPSKIINYDESIIGKFTFILDEISLRQFNIYELFDKLKKKFDSLEEYLLTIEVLYLLNKIELCENSEVIKYVG